MCIGNHQSYYSSKLRYFPPRTALPHRCTPLLITVRFVNRMCFRLPAPPAFGGEIPSLEAISIPNRMPNIATLLCTNLHRN
jgi:hypothetical protein